MSYSQFDEEKHILEAFASMDSPGRFLDIGCWDPITFSNTRALVEKGWSGVMIEPAPGPFIELLLCCTKCGVGLDQRAHLVYGKRARKACPECGADTYGYSKRLTLIQAAAALTDGYVEMEVTDDALSSSNEGNLETWKDAGGFYGRMRVPTITLDTISNQFGGFHFVNIDAEGISVDLFKHAIQNLNWRPRVWCVEIDGRDRELAAIAEACGYRSVNDQGTFTLGNGTNTVLVQK